MHRPLALVAALLVFALALPASGAVIVYLPVDDLVRNSDAVVRGKVISSKAYREEANGHIYTRHTLSVSEYIKGKGEQQIAVLTLGGELEEFGQIVPGEARLAVGEEVVLCLARAKDDFVVYNMSQGKFGMSLQDGNVTVAQDFKGLHFVGRKNPAPAKMTLDAFRDMVHKVTE